MVLLCAGLYSCANKGGAMNGSFDETKFWSLIDKSRTSSEGNYEVQCEKLTLLLESEKPEDIAKFDSIFLSLQDKAYTWKLWAAAYVINGGCADDCFIDFRSWLIGQGQNAFNNVISNPDTLVQMKIEPDKWEGLQYCAIKAYKKLTGKDLPLVNINYSKIPKGEELDMDDQEKMKSILPNLFKKYGSQSNNESEE